ncbi:MAG: hypothetical protein HKL83_02865 [Acidimicrobiaceae bacterium]|nr:hypothetical protein [Acidimicrobiaceae bacterium]
MSNLLYVLIPILFFTVVGLLLGLKDRKLRSTESYVDEFSRARQAMAGSKSGGVVDLKEGREAG